MLSSEQLTELRSSEPMPNRVKAAMRLCGVTQVELAAAVGITQPQVSVVANGNYTKLPLDTAQRFSTFFGCAIEDLFPARVEVA